MTTEQELFSKLREMAAQWRNTTEKDMDPNTGLVLINEEAEKVIGWTFELAQNLLQPPFREFYGTYVVDVDATIYQALGRTNDGMARRWERIDRVKRHIYRVSVHSHLGSIYEQIEPVHCRRGRRCRESCDCSLSD